MTRGWRCSCRTSGGGGGSNQYYDSIGYYEADDVAACVAYVQKNLAAGKPIFLYGQSMGAAAVARAVAVYQLDVGGIVLQSVFDTLENAVTRQFARVGLPKFPAVPLMLFWGGRATNMPAQAHNPVDYAASIHCPALVLHGTADVEAPLAEGRRVFNALPGDRSIYLFKGLGHVSLIHEDPVNWKREVIGFVRAHGG